MSLHDRTLVCDACKVSFPQSRCVYWNADEDLRCALCENKDAHCCYKCGEASQFRTLPEQAFVMYEDTVRYLMNHPRLKEGFQQFLYWYAVSKEDIQTYYYALHEKIHICHEHKAKFIPYLEEAYEDRPAEESK
jgi:hypothetical protein